MSRRHTAEVQGRFDPTSLIWGLIFALVAALGIWRGLGHGVNWSYVTHLSPLVLMSLGILGLVLNRSRH